MGITASVASSDFLLYRMGGPLLVQLVYFSRTCKEVTGERFCPSFLNFVEYFGVKSKTFSVDLTLCNDFCEKVSLGLLLQWFEGWRTAVDLQSNFCHQLLHLCNNWNKAYIQHKSVYSTEYSLINNIIIKSIVQTN